MNQLRHSSYLRLLLQLTVFGLLAISLFNAAVDPYWIIGSKEAYGFNKEKPEFWKQLLAGKAAVVRRTKPKAVVLGASRAMLGLDPEHICWKTEPVYNLGLEGPNFYEIRRYFEHADSVADLERIVLTLDLFTFNEYYERQTNFKDQRLARSKDEWVALYPYAPDLARSLISIDALKASYKTLVEQSEEAAFRKDGVRVRGWLKPVTGTAKSNMQNVFSKQFDRMVDLTWLPAPANKFSLTNAGGNSPLLDDLASLITRAHQNNIDVRILISPVHAQVLEVIHSIGLGDTYQEWMRQVVNINEQAAARLDRAPFPLWDFSGYNSITTESVPGPGELPATMKWYIEASHYSRATGNLILNRVLNCEGTTPVPQDFGRRISSRNIDSHLARLSTKGLQYRSSHALLANTDGWSNPVRRAED